MTVGQTYKIKVSIQEDGLISPRMKHVPAILLKEFPHFYLFKTKNYNTAINKRDANLIKEVGR